MKHLKKSLLSAVLLSFVLVGCNQSSTPAYTVYSFSVENIRRGQRVEICSKNGEVSESSVYPFKADITVKYYLPYQGERERDLESSISFDYQKYHAYFDRHNYYLIDGTMINNLKVLNDSYGSGEYVKLPKELYDGIKMAYDFCDISEYKYALAIGNLSTLWDFYISSSVDKGDDEVLKYYSTNYAEQRVVFTDVSSKELNVALSTTPTLAETKSMLDFDEDNLSIRFNSISRIDEFVSENVEYINACKNSGRNYSRPSISLSGFAKGQATELISNKYVDKVMLFNSGYSSVRCNNVKQDNSSWEISVSNPYYNEAQRWDYFSDLDINSSDVMLSINEGFNLSTSGYYNNYFYTDTKDEQGNRTRRNHIIDPTTGYSHQYFASCSLFLENSGYADMFTTAMINCDSVEEAQSLLTKMNTETKLNGKAIYLVNDSYPEKHTTCYAPTSLMDKISYSHEKYEEYFPYASITSIEEIK